MLLKDLAFKFGDYRNTSNHKKNKALDDKIKKIPSYRAFNMTMYKLGVTQRKKQHCNLITSLEDINLSEYRLNNTLKLKEDNIVFEDFIDERKYIMPKGKTVEIYTKKYKNGFSGTTITALDVLFMIDGEILVINNEE